MKLKTIAHLLLIASFLSFTGCKSVKSTKDTHTTVTDTIYKERTVTVRDTVIKTEPAKVGTVVPAAEFKGALNPIKKQYKNATLNIKKERDTVYIDCECDTLAITAHLHDVYEKEYRARSELNRIEALEKKELTQLQIFMIMSGYLLWVIVIVSTVYYINKYRKS